jgi:hypothetical protein
MCDGLKNWAEKCFAKWLILTMFCISTVETSGSVIKDLVNVISRFLPEG